MPNHPKVEAVKSPLQPLLSSSLYQLKGLYMRIHFKQSQVEIFLSSKINFGQIPIDIVFATSLEVQQQQVVMMRKNWMVHHSLSKFESIVFGGVFLPLFGNYVSG